MSFTLVNGLEKYDEVSENNSKEGRTLLVCQFYLLVFPFHSFVERVCKRHAPECPRRGESAGQENRSAIRINMARQLIAELLRNWPVVGRLAGSDLGV